MDKEKLIGTCNVILGKKLKILYKKIIINIFKFQQRRLKEFMKILNNLEWKSFNQKLRGIVKARIQLQTSLLKLKNVYNYFFI